MDAFALSCKRYSEFPQNVIQSKVPAAERTNLFLALEERENSKTFQLFEEESRGSLSLCELLQNENGLYTPI
jgi:hypothetical protein